MVSCRLPTMRCAHGSAQYHTAIGEANSDPCLPPPAISSTANAAETSCLVRNGCVVARTRPPAALLAQPRGAAWTRGGARAAAGQSASLCRFVSQHRRPLSALEGWRDAAERTLLGKEPASEADGGALGPTGPHVASSRSSDDSRRAVSSGKNPAATCGSASTTGADDAGGRRRAVWPATLAVPQTIAHTVSA